MSSQLETRIGHRSDLRYVKEGIQRSLRKFLSSSQVVLATTIASSNSNIPAGVATFNPFLREQGLETQMAESLQKCSDREAKIYFSHSWRDVRKVKDLES